MVAGVGAGARNEAGLLSEGGKFGTNSLMKTKFVKVEWRWGKLKRERESGCRSEPFFPRITQLQKGGVLIIWGGRHVVIPRVREWRKKNGESLWRPIEL